MAIFWERTAHSVDHMISLYFYYTERNKNLKFCNKMVPAENFGTIWILVIIFDRRNITATKLIRRKWKMRPMELSGVIFSMQGSESECSCCGQIL